ncbi:TIGR03620 family F420-dependent LLM class oxidoreductase [Paraconexibacter antarcticus]|uniref:TIGR03620 family F420-dependent LLM class oxidoreductase n=1 Tax=Paraconexibacter antarcticus TaxID=2949664 RepID=A0ABY5DRB5_9ACTN|nr:TIGR03620 family F420-dependent LLM class oxidoreductase [Paraconexibacter antarcticus]UTI63225.1 TIGR03620 family F420-dependent LLM class oxidoreductase [Paraconexibacter antarcticus]
MTTLADRLRPVGVWTFTDALAAPDAVEFARRIEALGYSALWHPETVGRDPLVHLGHLAGATSTLLLASGIANLYNRHPGAMKQAAHTLAEQSGGRFINGIGVSHRPLVEGVRGLSYDKPLTAMRGYLDAMEQSPYTGPEAAEPPPVVLAALGPKMLALAGERTAGAHPYFTTPAHTRQAREILGPDKLLCVEQKVILTTDETAARAAAAPQIDRYGALPNYRNNWQRLGYTEEQIEAKDPAFVDDLIVWGDADTIRARIAEDHDAGATHVCIQPVSVQGRPTPDLDVLEALAPE